jgi:hypothetical protein
MANLALWKHPRGRAGVTGAFASLAQPYRDLLHRHHGRRSALRGRDRPDSDFRQLRRCTKFGLRSGERLVQFDRREPHDVWIHPSGTIGSDPVTIGRYSGYDRLLPRHQPASGASLSLRSRRHSAGLLEGFRRGRPLARLTPAALASFKTVRTHAPVFLATRVAFGSTLNAAMIALTRRLRAAALLALNTGSAFKRFIASLALAACFSRNTGSERRRFMRSPEKAFRLAANTGSSFMRFMRSIRSLRPASERR